MDAGLPTRDVYELNFIWQTLTVEIYTADVQGGGHGDGLSEDIAFGAGDTSDVLQEILDPTIDRGDLRVGVPKMMEQLDGVE